MLKKREACNKKNVQVRITKGGNEKKKVYIEVEDNMQRKNKGGGVFRELEICARSKSTKWVT